jgi:hypothetical protein
MDLLEEIPNACLNRLRCNAKDDEGRISKIGKRRPMPGSHTGLASSSAAGNDDDITEDAQVPSVPELADLDAPSASSTEVESREVTTSNPSSSPVHCPRSPAMPKSNRPAPPTRRFRTEKTSTVGASSTTIPE